MGLFKRENKYDPETGVFLPPKQKNYLYLIPVQLLIDVAVFFIALKIDEANYTPSPNGSFMIPVVTFLAILVMGFITIMVATIAVILTIKSKQRYKKADEM